MSPDIKLAVGFAVWGVFATGIMALLGWVLPKVRERGQEVCQQCDGCGCAIDLDEDGGHIYPDGSVVCPQCEDD